MTVTKESEGRLNAFAKEPQIEVISEQPSSTNGFKLLIAAGSLLLIGLFAFSFTIK
tara:strand:+ start:3172 stop:3339 length:168 start_codon:yes stop_codon:yes gene_type:complete